MTVTAVVSLPFGVVYRVIVICAPEVLRTSAVRRLLTRPAGRPERAMNQGRRADDHAFELGGRP